MYSLLRSCSCVRAYNGGCVLCSAVTRGGVAETGLLSAVAE